MQRTILPLALVLLSIAVPASAQKEPGKLALICGKVLTMDEKDTVHDNVVVFIGDGKIERIVPIKSATIPPGYEVHDHSNKWLVPGLIDCHNHTGTDASNDLHDYVWLTNAGLRAGDMIGVDTKDNRRSLAGGVTTALLIPGSGTNMSGFGGIVRFGALTQEEAIMRSPASL